MGANAAQHGQIYRTVAALPGQPLFRIAIDLHTGNAAGKDRSAFHGAGHQRHGVRRGGAADEKALRPLLSKSEAELLQRLNQPTAPVRSGLAHQIGQHLAPELHLIALLQRREARHQAGLGRKCRQQRLAETVDRLDAQPPAGRVQHLGKQPPRPGLILRAERRADRH